ncbi:MAG: cobyric acid synthase [Lentilitoribacter sp.]
MTKALMFQGTGSDVGKTVLVSGLCRLASNRGINVMPFKPQNMSNNAAVANDGGEIGRGQWLQALASRVDPSIHMNPVLLKPQSEIGSQVVVHGKSRGHAKAREYKSMKPQLMEAVIKSYRKLQESCDLVLVEGAGSPAEINLRAGDIANMGFAREADVPVVLIGDIDRGGVIASIVGTHTILPDDDRDMIKAYLINKFRGDVTLFDDGIKAIESFTKWPCLGVVPWLKAVGKLPPEDSVALDHLIQSNSGQLKIAIPKIPRIANFDDFDPLVVEDNVNIKYIQSGERLPVDTDIVILPGSKSTIADLDYLKCEGWQQALQEHLNRGGQIIGVCGGYQMLGRKIYDPEHIESELDEIDGFGLLDIETEMAPQKITENVIAETNIFNARINGYEIHIGRTSGADCERPFSVINGNKDGAISRDGKVMGTYLHGLFTSDAFRDKLLTSHGITSSETNYEQLVDDALNELANELEKLVDFDQLLDIAAHK